MTEYRFVAFVTASVVATAWWLLIALFPWSRNLPPAMRRAVYAPLVWLVAYAVMVDNYDIHPRAAMWAAAVVALLFILPILLVGWLTNPWAIGALMTLITSTELFAILYAPVDRTGPALYAPVVFVGGLAAVLSIKTQRIDDDHATKWERRAKMFVNGLSWVVETLYTTYWTVLWIAVVASSQVEYTDLAWRRSQWGFWLLFVALCILRFVITRIAASKTS